MYSIEASTSHAMITHLASHRSEAPDGRRCPGDRAAPLLSSRPRHQDTSEGIIKLRTCHHDIITSTPEVSLGAVVWVNMEQTVLTVILCGRAEIVKSICMIGFISSKSCLNTKEEVNTSRNTEVNISQTRWALDPEYYKC